ncbi:winged helix-turn-helix domain-containing protein [Pluralibacter sp.]|uniref:winged helix-turn-helix domain-containing protein n=1 Tax=Pluralibacter sp. TaxID=1920032 RepID=UPI0025E7C545|nr:winged helix-turn-helix domain-containing protein [Pluralibacter sp.]MBV8045204.1 winged helix-turn-helix domain-containing protein [Pluralibacter sp.]
MKTAFLINDTILFVPEQYSLYRRENYPAGRITLHAPASDCLLLLIQHAQQPVSQKMLFEQVWQKRGTVVSTNTLYQSIASVRKGLKATGLAEEAILTLPKQGFKCVAQITPGELQDFILTSSENAEPLTEPTHRPAKALRRPVIKPLRGLRPRSRLSLLLAIVLVLIVGEYHWLRASPSPLYAEYAYAGKVENCQVWSSWSGTQYSIAVFDKLRQRSPISCTAESVAYLTINRLQQGTSILLCDKDIAQRGTQCRSWFYREEGNEK